jgi:hypothetical protein
VSVNATAKDTMWLGKLLATTSISTLFFHARAKEGYIKMYLYKRVDRICTAIGVQS